MIQIKKQLLLLKNNILKNLSKPEIKRISFLKKFYIISIVSLMILLFIDVNTGKDSLLLLHITRILGLIVAYLILYKNKYYSSIMLSFISIFITTIYGAVSVEFQNTFHLLLFPLCAVLFYLTKKILLNIFFFILSTGALIYIYYYKSIYQYPIFDSGTWFSIIIIMFFFFSILAFFVYEFTNLEEELHEKNYKLNQKNLEVIENNKNLTDSNLLITKLLNVIAHDLRNPFNSIMGFSNLLYKNIDKYNKEKQLEFIKLIAGASEKGYGILESILSWTRAKSHKIELNYEKIDMYKLILDVENELEIFTHQKNIILEHKGLDSFLIFTDKLILKIIVRNLLANAIKFSPLNEIITIELDNNTSKYINITITNVGTKINEDVVDKIFDKETQYSTYGSLGEKGIGLGMIICLDFAERLNANIKLTNNYDGCISFSLILPIDL